VVSPEAGVRGKPAKLITRDCITFGGDMPQRPGDYGIENVNGMAWLVRSQEADETRKRSTRRSAAAQAEPEELFIQRLIPADALRIRGRHNAVNALAALALAQAAGCSLGPMLYGLREYRGEPHRLESVALIDGVEYFDDSKGTNVGATVAAISGLGAERRVVVILGGLGKGQDFSPLLGAGALDEAVEVAAQRAAAGDAVLLSPACSSFDMFDSYVQRGEMFCAIVRERALDAGQTLEGGL
jgi:UDP-N-acetylmuramoylalanine--D-glutamate ligase